MLTQINASTHSLSAVKRAAESAAGQLVVQYVNFNNPGGKFVSMDDYNWEPLSDLLSDFKSRGYQMVKSHNGLSSAVGTACGMVLDAYLMFKHRKTGREYIVFAKRDFLG